MIAVQDPAVAERLRRLRAHGMDAVRSRPPRRRDVVFEAYPERGFNARMTDMQAALGSASCGRSIDPRAPAPLADALHRGTRADPAPRAAVRPAVCDAHVAVLLRADRPRRPDRAHGADAAPAARRHRHPPRRDGDPRRGLLRRAVQIDRTPLGHTEAAAREALMLPLFPDLTEEQQDYVIERLAASVLARAA